MAEKRAELTVKFGDENMYKLGTDTFGELMAASQEFQLPIDQEWTMAVVLYWFGPPIRVYISYDMEGEELIVTEKRNKEKYHHTLPALATGGPIPIPHILGWMENGLALVREWIQW